MARLVVEQPAAEIALAVLGEDHVADREGPGDRERDPVAVRVDEPPLPPARACPAKPRDQQAERRGEIGVVDDLPDPVRPPHVPRIGDSPEPGKAYARPYDRSSQEPVERVTATAAATARTPP
ncbi:hypothetical protein Mame01_66090 [Microbispora amethystogenes]|nr:hypothetical protein Mame01_66090 [Microbispora amethystogenes]